MLPYADLISRGDTRGRQFHVLHVREQAPDSDVFPGHVPDLTRDELEGCVSDYMGDSPPTGEIICSVVKGATLIEILRYTTENDIDCLLVGCGRHGKRPLTDRAVLARRLARKATHSVLALPNDASGKISRVLVPIRNTDLSARATEMACTVASGVKAGVSCLNIFPTGSGDSKTGLSPDNQIDRLKTVAEEEAQRMLTRVDVGDVSPEVRVVPDPYDRPAEIIFEEAEKAAADLIAIGSRGRTGTAGVLLGKVTEELIAQSRLPVLAVKRKGEQIGILQALLSLM
jgi:nucleotide-binding universal stress UspA family protein